MQDIKVIALTGEIGAGKSTAAKILEAMGGVRLDADEIALSLWQRQDIKDKAVTRWGNILKTLFNCSCLPCKERIKDLNGL